MKKILAFLLILALLASLASAMAEGIRYEGNGFDSPEDAAQAYIEAFSAGNVQGMLSTFAIETAVDHLNQRAGAKRAKAFMYTSNQLFPVIDGYSRDLAIAGRVGELASILKYQFLTYAWPAEYGEFEQSIVGFKGDDAEADVDRFYDGFADRFGSVEIIGYMTPEELHVEGPYNSAGNQKALQSMCTSYGCDELVDRAVKLRIADEEYLQFIQCARFGDRWYLYSLNGTLAIIAGLSVYTGGLVPLSELF